MGIRSRLRNLKRLYSFYSNAEAGAIVSWSHAPDELGALFSRYGSDKSSHPDEQATTFAWPTHNYDFVYSEALEGRREDVKILLEVGIGTQNLNITSNMGSLGMPGASLRAWRDYLPNAHVIGADIDRSTFFHEDRITCVHVDQRDHRSIMQMWATVGNPKVDIVVDDGEHTVQSTINFAKHSLPHLKDDGLYFVEDIAIRDVGTVVEHLTSFGLAVTTFCFAQPGALNKMDGCLLMCRKLPT